MPKTYLDFVREAKARIREISVADARAAFEGGDTLFLDVREPDEVMHGAIPGAVALPRGLLEGHAPEAIPAPGAPVVVVCAAGNRSALAADVLQQMGFTNVKSLAGGLRAWAMSGHPIGTAS